MPVEPRTNLKKNDYLYALEVAGQPANTPAEKAVKRQAKADMKYLEAKYPKYTASIKNPQTRYQTSEFNAKAKPKVSSTRIGNMSNSRGTRPQ